MQAESAYWLALAQESFDEGEFETMVNQYWQHKTSGEVFVVQVDNVEETVISACGPLEWREVTAENLKDWNFNNDPDLVEDLNLNFDEYRVKEVQE